MLTKLCRVKAMVFPVVMYRCESFTMKKIAHRRTDAFKLWCWRRLFFFWLCWVFVPACGLSLVATSRGYSLIVVHGLLIKVLPLLWSTGSSVRQFKKLWHSGCAPQHAESSQKRDRAQVPCTGRWILNH